MTMLEVRDVSKSYQTAAGPLPVLNGVSLTLQRGDAAAVMGPSGSGKSTLLHVLGALDPPDSGEVLLNGRNPFSMKEAEQARFRNGAVGFLFQDHCLLPQLNLLENVLTPTLVGDPAPDAVARARMLLDQVGLGGRLDHLPSQLSGGEKQRAALARALIRRPLLLLCDEPTGNLDQASAETVAALLSRLHQEQNTILIVVTHSRDLASRFEKRFQMVGGRLLPL